MAVRSERCGRGDRHGGRRVGRGEGDAGVQGRLQGQGEGRYETGGRRIDSKGIEIAYMRSADVYFPINKYQAMKRLHDTCIKIDPPLLCTCYQSPLNPLKYNYRRMHARISKLHKEIGEKRSCCEKMPKWLVVIAAILHAPICKVTKVR